MKKTIITILILFIAIQFIRIEKTNPPFEEKTALNAPENVKAILKRSCYDCHSNETKWPWYSNIAPLSWSIASHVKDARAAFNFSNYENIKTDIKIKRLKRAVQTVNNSMMPLSSYLWFHKDAKLTKNEKKILSDWFQKEIDKLKL